METTSNKATCPQCGAEGTAGRFCEYCGTKLPEPIPVNTGNDISFFNWNNVIKTPWDICYRNLLDNHNKFKIIGESCNSLFMIVEAYGKKRIINRDGVFVTDDCSDIYIYTDNYDCVLVKCEYSLETKKTYYASVLNNLSTGKTIETFDCALQHYKRFLIGAGKNVVIYDRLERQMIKFDKTIPEGFEFQRSDDEEDLVVFRCDQRVCKVKISGNQGFVTFIEPQVIVSAPKVEMPKEAVVPKEHPKPQEEPMSLWVQVVLFIHIFSICIILIAGIEKSVEFIAFFYGWFFLISFIALLIKYDK